MDFVLMDDLLQVQEVFLLNMSVFFVKSLRQIGDIWSFLYGYLVEKQFPWNGLGDKLEATLITLGLG